MTDPEPVMIVIGERNWTRRAPSADVLIGEVARLDDVEAVSTRLFTCYPGLAVVALVAGQSVVLAFRCRQQRRSGIDGVVAAVAVLAYFGRACGQPDSPIDAGSQPTTEGSGTR